MSNREFPHLNDTKFPDLPTVDVYKYKNDIDYDIYEPKTKIKLMNVSWCGDYENAVYFETKEKRDEWLDKQNGIVRELSTMFRLYASGDIKIDIPIDECMNYNYLVIDYGQAPLQTENSGYQRMCYFISNMKQDSINTTRLFVDIDYWTSYIYDMGISYVNLVRGHAPMAESKIDDYLENPIDNSEYLLTDDVNFGTLQRVTNTTPVIFNDEDVVLGFLTNASMQMAWIYTDGKGIEHPITPTAAWESSQAFSSVDIFILDDISEWESFRSDVVKKCPQFLQTVKGMFIIPRKLISYPYGEHDEGFMFVGHKCHFVGTSSDKNLANFKLSKEMFGYPEEINDITKLYTAPYACIEVNDFKGNTTQIKIEDTTGNLELHTMMCDMYPFLNIEAYLIGLGGQLNSTVKFVNNYSCTMNIGGKFYDFSTKWSIPVFSVQLESNAGNDGYFVDNDWDLNDKLLADANYNAVNATADTEYNCTYDNNTTTLNNFKLSRGWAYKKTQILRDYVDNCNRLQFGDAYRTIDFGDVEAFTDPSKSKGKVLCDLYSDILLQNRLTQIGIEKGLQITANNGYANIISGGVSSLATAATGAITASGTIASSVGDSATASANTLAPYTVANGGVAGASNVITGGISSITSAINYGVAAGCTEQENEVTCEIMSRKVTNACAATHWQWEVDTDKDWKILEGEVGYNENTAYSHEVDGLSSKQTKNIINTSNENAENIQSNTKTNAENIYNAKHNQVRLSNHPEYGQLTGTPDIISKPFGVTFNIVTQSKNAIRQAAEQFMRFGYMLNMQWKVTSFNLMNHFTYWKCSNIYCVGYESEHNVYEGAQNVIKSILENGITVWRKPEEIGNVSIYQNGIE